VALPAERGEGPRRRTAPLCAVPVAAGRAMAAVQAVALRRIAASPGRAALTSGEPLSVRYEHALVRSPHGHAYGGDASPGAGIPPA
jgi:hypothetical protein